MFDLTSAKLMILAVVALVVVGPKDFPVLLRSIGRYIGLLKRHAEEFRTQFDQAMRESELADMKAEVEKMSREIEANVRAADHEFASAATEAGQTMNASLAAPVPPPASEAAAVSEPPPVTPAVTPQIAPDAAGSAPPPSPVPSERTPLEKIALEKTGA